jgi:cyclopropane fatty-acyl-phospholipid synthase-like methyltransferase
MHNFEYSEWRNATKETAPNLILTGVKTDKEADGFKPSTAFINWMSVHAKVLDFGAGIGRNTFTLADKYQTVHAFDFPNMIAILKDRMPDIYNVTTYTDWNDVKCQKYDAIFASLVLQHIFPADLYRYSDDFAKMTTTIYLITRNYTDGYRQSVYDILSKNWQIEDIYKDYKSPPMDTIEKIKKASGEAHYAVKLRSI